MIVYLLWFNEWEANYCLGVFETEKEAQKYKDYFIKYPNKEYGGPSMTYYAKHKDDYPDRFEIEQRTIGDVTPAVDNLKFLELEEQKNAQANT